MIGDLPSERPIGVTLWRCWIWINPSAAEVGSLRVTPRDSSPRASPALISSTARQQAPMRTEIPRTENPLEPILLKIRKFGVPLLVASFIKAAIRRSFPNQWVAYTTWKRGYVEPEIAYLPKIVPRNRVSIDVGANIGVYTRALAKLTPHVYAFEPSKELASLLPRIIPANVTVLKSAASDRSGSGILNIPVEDGRKTVGLATLSLQPSSCDLKLRR